jgi:hypothetical protein
MNEELLYSLTEILETFSHLENVNLVGNTKLGSGRRGEGAIASFMQRVGRKCKVSHWKIHFRLINVWH